ncbi:MAG: tRNA (adenosine(37)-N6)-dimethylallyltransferase MiaA [Anaerolineales bacterium]|nr:tRNA (adenosine(37)-N6)-dimethylallyltransferase MiaA [Anaerolineales bacterium]
MSLSLSLLVIVGPTAVGKTATAIALAEKHNAEIISADSRYLYVGMDIGTAKPTPAERARVPHHLIDVTTPDQPWTLAQVQAAAYAAIEAVYMRGKLPILVGGTGQYIRAITEGWQAPGGEPSAKLRAELDAELARGGVAALAERLRAVDPASAAVVDLRNPRRVIRALEVALTTGESFIAQRRKNPPPYAITTLGLGLPRPELYARIDARIEAMLANGLEAEVRTLVAKGYGWELPAMSALGYKQMGAYLRGECDLAEAVRRIQHDTRVFVRRQANWFKADDPEIKWIDARRAGELEDWRL